MQADAENAEAEHEERHGDHRELDGGRRRDSSRCHRRQAIVTRLSVRERNAAFASSCNSSWRPSRIEYLGSECRISPMNEVLMRLYSRKGGNRKEMNEMAFNQIRQTRTGAELLCRPPPVARGRGGRAPGCCPRLPGRRPVRPAATSAMPPRFGELAGGGWRPWRMGGWARAAERLGVGAEAAKQPSRPQHLPEAPSCRIVTAFRHHRRHIAPVHRDGHKFIGAALLVTLLLFLLGRRSAGCSPSSPPG